MRHSVCRSVLLSGLSLAAFPAISQAVIIGSGNGTENTTQGSMPNGWNYVGSVSSASGVYLGNGWVLTAYHVSSGLITPGTHFTLGSTSYTGDTTAIRLTNPDTTPADLQMFHIANAPNLPWLSISSASPSNGTSIYMVGYGMSNPRNVNPTYYSYSVIDGTWTVKPTSGGANAGGFGYATGTQKRWGTNLVEGTSASDIGFGLTHLFTADFYGSTRLAGLNNYLSGSATAYEATVTSGDSGGGVFSANNTLLGINNYTSIFTNQPANTVIFGNGTAMADLSVYRNQIVGLVPEPSSLALVFGAFGTLVARRRHSPR